MRVNIVPRVYRWACGLRKCPAPGEDPWKGPVDVTPASAFRIDTVTCPRLLVSGNHLIIVHSLVDDARHRPALPEGWVGLVFHRDTRSQWKVVGERGVRAFLFSAGQTEKEGEARFLRAVPQPPGTI